MKSRIPKWTSNTTSTIEASRGRFRNVRNSRSRCGCGGAHVFECVDDSMPRIDCRRLTLDDRDDRGRDRVQRERPKVGPIFSSDLWTQKKNPIRHLDAKRKSYRLRRYEEQPNERERKTTRQNNDVMNECSCIVSLIVLEVSPDVPSRASRKPPRWAPGLLGPKIVTF